MSKVTVSNAIQTALANDALSCTGARIDAQEARDIIYSAERSVKTGRNTPVTKGEIGLIGDLFERRFESRPGQFFTLACPESPGQFTMDRDAVEEFDKFFTRHGAPFGSDQATLKDKLLDRMGDLSFGNELEVAPDVSNMQHVFLKDGRMADGPRYDAYVDRAGSEFFMQVTGAGMGGPQFIGPFWYGPFDLNPAPKHDKQALVDTFTALGNVDWHTGGLPVGGRYDRVELYKEPGFDRYAYAAHVSKSNPDSFFVERSGGFAGITMYAGPFTIGQTPAPKAELPDGMWRLSMEVVQGFGALGTSVAIRGGLSNPAWNEIIGDAEVDQLARTVNIEVGAERTHDGAVIMVTKEFAREVQLPTLRPGSWTFNLVNCDGDVLESSQASIFPRF